MNLRQSLITQSPSLELQRAAASEIARLDAIIGGPTLAPPMYSRANQPAYGKVILAIEAVMTATAQLHAAGVSEDDWPDGLVEIRRRARLTHASYIDENKRLTRAASKDL